MTEGKKYRNEISEKNLLPNPSLRNVELADDSRRRSGDEHVLGNVLVHEASGGDDRVLPDRDAGQNRAARSDPYVVSDDDRFARIRTIVRVELVVHAVEDAGARADFDVGPDRDALAGRDADPCVNERIIADFQYAALFHGKLRRPWLAHEPNPFPDSQRP